MSNNQVNTKNIILLESFENESGQDSKVILGVKKILKDSPFSTKAFFQIDQSDVEKYFDANSKTLTNRTIVGKIRYLKIFRDYVVKKFPEKFSSEFLLNLNDLTNKFPFKKKEKKYLEIDQIALIKITLADNKKYQFIEFLFNVFYQTDINQVGIRDAISDLCIDKYVKKPTESTQKKIHELQEKTRDEANPYIANTLKDFGNELQKKFPKTFPTTFRLSWTIIKNSRKRYFFECPCCGFATENIAENWVLIKTENGLSYRLVCSKCKGVD